MKRTVVFIVAACCALSALSLAEDKRQSKPPATVSPAQQFGTSAIITKPITAKPKPTTTTTTPKPTTTTPKPTTTTPKPTTTTPKPTTTTPKPTTTKPNATTTTPKPTTTKPNATTTTPKPTTTNPNATTTSPKPTTTTPKPTATPEPTPPTNLTVGKYRLMTEKKVVCLMADMALQIQLATPQANGTFNVVPEKTETKGSCGETKANLTIVFKEGFITFMFNKSVANNTAYVDALSFKLSYAFSKGALRTYSASNSSIHLFAAKIGNSYSCKDELIHMGGGLYLDVNQDRMQAFNLTKSNDFGLPDVCPADKPDYRVAIGVGVTLLVLIVIVVIAYLLSRRRRTDGYQTL